MLSRCATTASTIRARVRRGTITDVAFGQAAAQGVGGGPLSELGLEDGGQRDLAAFAFRLRERSIRRARRAGRLNPLRPRR